MPAADQILHAVDSYRRWLLAFAAILLFASFSPHWRITPDSALFMGIARNLDEGRGFTFNEQVVTSVNAGFPYLLASARSVAADPIIVGNLLMMVTGMASLVLVYLLVMRQAGRSLAVLVTVLTATNGTFLRHSCEILADIPFFFCCMIALLGYEQTYPKHGVDSARDSARAGGRLILASAFIVIGLAGMASLRIVFLGPLFAILIDLLWRARRSRFKWAVIAGGAGVLLVALAIRLADPRMAGGFTLLGKERELLETLRDFPATASRVLSFNAPQLFTDITPRAIFGNKIGVWPLDVAISLAVLIAGVVLLRRRVAWAVLIIIYFVQWLLIFPDVRYFLPVLPLLILGWWDLSVLATGRLTPRCQRAALFALFALLAVPSTARSIGFAFEQHQRPFLSRYLRGRFQDLPEFAPRARKMLPTDAILLTSGQFAGPMHYFSGIRTIATVGATLPVPLPPDRPVFVMVPGEAQLDAALSTLGFTRGELVLSGPDRGAATLTIFAARR